MGPLGSILGAAGRQVNRLVNAALGWAGLLLFGKLPPGKQRVLLGVTFGSLVWVVSLIGILFPNVGTMIIAVVPVPQQIDENLVRLAMLIAAIVLPILIGIALIWLTPADRREKGAGMLKTVIRGYPFAFAMALTVVFLGVVASIRKISSIARRWEEAHVTVVVKPGHYEELVGDLERALDDAGLDIDRKPAPKVLATPARILGKIAGSGLSDLVPERLWSLVRKDLDILVHPSDVLIAGKKEVVARARAAMAIKLTWAPAYLTTTPDAQKLEDGITSVATLSPQDADRKFGEIDRQLADVVLPYEEWETLYRIRLQVQTERAGVDPDVAGQGDTSPVEDKDGGHRGRGGADGNGRPAMLPWLAAGGVAALLLADVVLLATRGGNPSGSRSRR